MLTHDDKKNRWETRFKPDSFTNSKGVKVTSEQLKPLMTAMGDSVVTKRSLSGETRYLLGKKTILPITSEVYQCEGHSKLVTNPEIQDKLFTILNAAALAAK